MSIERSYPIERSYTRGDGKGRRDEGGRASGGADGVLFSSVFLDIFLMGIRSDTDAIYKKLAHALAN